MHIVIGGQDEVAFHLAEELMREHAVSLVCPKSALGPRSDRLDVEIIGGAPTAGEVLRRARVSSCDHFIGCMPTDELNLVACVTAKRLGARRTVCFLFRPDFQAELGEDSSLAESFDIDSIVRPAEQLGHEILRIVTVPGALDVEIFEGGRVGLLRQAVAEGAHLSAAPLQDLDIPSGVRFVMGRRGEEVFLPRGDTHFEPGDKVTLMGEFHSMNRLVHRYLRDPGAGVEARRATIVGGGTVGMTVALGLERAGWGLKVIESDRERCQQIAPLLGRALVLHGDGADLDLLQSEQVEADSVLVAVTSNDEKNLLVSLLAKHLGIPRIVTRATFQETEKLFEKVGIDVVRSGRGMAIQSVLRSIQGGNSTLLAELEHGDAMVLELELPEGFKQMPLHRLHAPSSAIIGAVARGRRMVVPSGQEVIGAGDRILVFCLREQAEEVHRFFLEGRG